MLRNLALIETDACLKRVQTLFATHKEILQYTLFATINPYHQIELKKLGLNFIGSSNLIADHEQLVAAQQITLWLEAFEKKNSELAAGNFKQAIIFEHIFYLQFLLGHSLFLFLLLTKARELYPKIEHFVKLIDFQDLNQSGPYLKNEESAQAQIADQIFKITINLRQEKTPAPEEKLDFWKKYVLKLAAQIQKMHLNKLERILKKEQGKQPIMVNNHRALYAWAQKQNPGKEMWMVKSPVRDYSWVRILSFITLPFVQHFFPKYFKKWAEKNYKNQFRFTIDPFPLSFLKNSQEQVETIADQIFQQNTFIFKLSKKFYPNYSDQGIYLKEKMKKGLTPYIRNLEKSFANLASYLAKASWREQTHFYNHDNTALAGLIGEASFLNDIDSTLVTHGSHPLHSDPIISKEFLRHGLGLFISRHKYTAVQSDISRQFAMNFIKNSKLIETGPVAFGLMPKNIVPGTYKKKFFGNENVLMYLHAGTYKGRNSTRFLIYETVDEYVRNLNELIANIEQMNTKDLPKKIKLVIKIRPTSYLDASKLRAILSPSIHYVVEDQIPFLNLLTDAEGVISFSSTTLEEALLNKKSIFLLKRKNFSFFEPQNQLISKSKSDLTFF